MTTLGRNGNTVEIFDGSRPSEEVCPSGLIRLGGLERYVRAYRAHDKGELLTFFPSPDNALLEGVEALAYSAGVLEACEIDSMRSK